MAAIPPVRLTVDRHALTVLRGVVSAALPDEGCALLLGTTGPSWHLQRIWPALNRWPKPAERARRFGLDPREQLVAQRWARLQGLVVLGAAHSHPVSAPVPSPTDIGLTVAPALMVILGRCHGRPEWDVGCWWLPEAEPGNSRPRPLRLPWTMVP